MRRHNFLKLSARAVMLAALMNCASLASARAEHLIERGSYLVNTILACGNCHTPKTRLGAAVPERNLAGGGLVFTTPAFDATAPNITPDPETGIGTWSGDDIKRALTEGIRPPHARLPGVPLAAIMPAGFYKALLPRDLDAIAAYLRSVKPIRNEVPVPVYKVPVVRDVYPDSETGFSESAIRDPVKLGAYLGTIGICMECHSARANGVSDFRNGLGKGGRKFGPFLAQGFPEAWAGSTAANITSHPAAGIGAWSDTEIKRAITQGVSRDGRTLKPPMAFTWYAGMSAADLDGIVAWLRSIPPLE